MFKLAHNDVQCLEDYSENELYNWLKKGLEGFTCELKNIWAFDPLALALFGMYETLEEGLFAVYDLLPNESKEKFSKAVDLTGNFFSDKGNKEALDTLVLLKSGIQKSYEPYFDYYCRGKKVF